MQLRFGDRGEAASERDSFRSLTGELIPAERANETAFEGVRAWSLGGDRKALSIQAHPDKELARRLHETLPDIYKDANHKPELAITEFEALCSFVSLEELMEVVAGVTEVGELIGNTNKDRVLQFNVKQGQEKFKPLLQEKFKPLLQEVFTQLMSADNDVVAEVISKVKIRLQSENQVRELTDKGEASSPICITICLKIKARLAV